MSSVTSDTTPGPPLGPAFPKTPTGSRLHVLLEVPARSRETTREEGTTRRPLTRSSTVPYPIHGGLPCTLSPGKKGTRGEEWDPEETRLPSGRGGAKSLPLHFRVSPNPRPTCSGSNRSSVPDTLGTSPRESCLGFQDLPVVGQDPTSPEQSKSYSDPRPSVTSQLLRSQDQSVLDWSVPPT